MEGRRNRNASGIERCHTVMLTDSRVEVVRQIYCVDIEIYERFGPRISLHPLYPARSIPSTFYTLTTITQINSEKSGQSESHGGMSSPSL